MPVNVEFTERDKKLLGMVEKLSMIKVENFLIFMIQKLLFKTNRLVKKTHNVRKLKWDIMLGSKGIEYVRSSGKSLWKRLKRTDMGRSRLQCR
ncbi:hypothetical protein SAMN02745195_00328 [Thermoanaerobacter uzonensis DSM 18761]|jgi:hypothetical protein|uniref:Uncharacterized protein n=1 Tax=Thermoanaerobacter uzonensis DSM 18761 TaxID=1123369 RepID=A0A1M4SZY8_9THEO|nr:hypothetical protein [Thermoanaerobacter uzonensis]SHE37754.1 hypothetical protein SAMN02745195_00328 [Thermoanaerobacter uzonensis DSM 18761]